MMNNERHIKLSQMGRGMGQMPRFNPPPEINVQGSLSRVPRPPATTLNTRRRLEAASRNKSMYGPSHDLVRRQQRQLTFDQQPRVNRKIVGTNIDIPFTEKDLKYKTVADAPVNPYSQAPESSFQNSYQAMQNPATLYSRYRGSGDGYSRFNPYTGGGLSAAAGVAGAGIASRLGRSALMGGLGGGLLGLGLYAGGNYLYNRFKDTDKMKNPYSYGGRLEYKNTDPRAWGRYNPPTTYDAKNKVDRTSSRQMKNVGGSQLAKFLLAGSGGLAGGLVGSMLGMGGLGKGVLAVGGAASALHAGHNLNKPGAWMDRNRERIGAVKRFLDVEGPRDGMTSNIRDPESYYAEGSF